MITIQRTVDIPANRRLTLDVPLPETVPSGRVSILLTFPQAEETPAAGKPEALNTPGFAPFPSLEELKAEAARKTAARLADPSRDSLTRYAGCLADSGVFEGDPVAIQREMRDEWD